jgi:hypothetical protein
MTRPWPRRSGGTTITEVRCSYDVANPADVPVSIYPEALLDITYLCLNVSTGEGRWNRQPEPLGDALQGHAVAMVARY